uniref:Uncharacterized protein n=1 Tax=Meloidogyne hapla TaxID=6305 RepID=A0A1I8B9M1_MELHA
MSAPFRDQLTLLHEQSLDLLDNQKTFQIPPNNVSISQFHSDIRNLIATLEIELEYVSEAISDISSTHDKWITVRANMTECLSGPALLLVKSLPLTDASYNEAIRLLKENYGQPEEINRNLHTSLRKLPIVHSNHGPDILCKELASFVDECWSNTFDANTLSIQMELESKLPPPILEEILKAKEAGNWTTDKLRTLLKTILKRKLGVCAIRDQNREVTPPQRQVKPNKFFTPSPSISDSYSPQNQSNQQSSSLSFATQRKEHNKFSKPPIVPRGPCLFCEDPATTPQENESESNPKDNHQINVSTSTMENYNTGPILLKCVRAKIFNPNNPTINKELILLLDDASTNRQKKL